MYLGMVPGNMGQNEKNSAPTRRMLLKSTLHPEIIKLHCNLFKVGGSCELQRLNYVVLHNAWEYLCDV